MLTTYNKKKHLEVLEKKLTATIEAKLSSANTISEAL